MKFTEILTNLIWKAKKRKKADVLIKDMKLKHEAKIKPTILKRCADENATMCRTDSKAVSFDSMIKIREFHRAKGEGKILFGKYDPTIETYHTALKTGCHVESYENFEEPRDTINSYSYDVQYGGALAHSDDDSVRGCPISTDRRKDHNTEENAQSKTDMNVN